MVRERSAFAFSCFAACKMDPDDTDANLNGRTYVIELGHSSYEIAGP